MRFLKVMLVDDEYLILERLKQIVDWNALGFEVSATAQDAFEAMQIFKEQIPDLVITDIHMPEMDGLAFSQWIRQRYSNVRILILTGYQEFEYVQQALRIGVNDFLVKPLDETEFTAILERTFRDIASSAAPENGTVKTQEDDERCRKNADCIWEALLNQDEGQLEKEIGQIPQRFTGDLPWAYGQLAFYLADHMIRLCGYSLQMLRMPVSMRQRMKEEMNPARWNEIFLDFLNEYREMLKSQQTDTGEAVYQRVMQYIEKNFRNNVGLNEMSQILGYNPAYLSRMIKKNTGKGFTELMTEYRIQQARELLVSTNHRINAIAQDVGFSDVKYFNQIFKKKVGMNPKSYRIYASRDDGNHSF